ncbi:DoxX family protein [Coraliomargarita sinensis]|uniref:DoxX family protein n=1 Tax=Coraliomargarita sinensis TaxID=2174842 RepID=A0A317ZKY4_9BACT|nr:DoxX family protein [Coraliomargarita sinensis]PXA04873.1 DoxX family protein [Coraliomargarita sinensis]
MKTPAYSKDLGLLILRIGIGAMFILHGIPKLLGGPGGWEGLAQFGLPFLPEGIVSVAFGFAAMATELGGGILLALGKFHRLVCAALAGVMFVAFTTKIGDVTGFGDFAKTAGWPLELMVVFIALFFTGPGRYVVGKR